MNILIIGQNGREHALANAYANSKKVKKIIMAPGNGLTDFNNKKIVNYPDVTMTNFEKIVNVCRKEKIDIVDVAQDDVIADGFVDKFEKLGIKAFGPSQKAARLEWDKKWSRNFMMKYKLPIPKFKSFNNQKKAIEYINSLYKLNSEQLLFIKASGLALGKGVIRAENKKQAILAIKQMSKFGKSGETFLIEEGLTGEEFSLFAICDSANYVITKPSQDHKNIYENDKGPNTGGVGCVYPTRVLNKKQIKEVEERIIKPTLLGMKKEGMPYKGILYVGGIITNNNIKIIEFNSRWGDPEAEVILPSIKTDYLKIVEHVLLGKLNKLKIKFDNKIRLSIAGCAKGYPIDYSKAKNKEVFGILNVLKIKDIKIFGSGIKRENNKFFVNGGRIFHVVAKDTDILSAQKKAYKTIKLISIENDNLYYRTDIGWREIARYDK